MEKQKVKTVTATGKSWTSKEGKTFNISTVVLEDGRTGETMSDKFKAGEEASFVVVEREYQGVKSLSFKWASDNFQNTKRVFDPAADALRQQMIIRQSSISNAINWMIAKADKDVDSKMLSSEMVFAVAEKIVEFVNKCQK